MAVDQCLSRINDNNNGVTKDEKFTTIRGVRMKYLNILGLGEIIAVILSGYLAYQGIDGWGWFLMVGIFMACLAEE